MGEQPVRLLHLGYAKMKHLERSKNAIYSAFDHFDVINVEKPKIAFPSVLISDAYALELQHILCTLSCLEELEMGEYSVIKAINEFTVAK